MISRIIFVSAIVLGFLGLIAGILTIAGFAPAGAFIALWQGSLGSWYALTSATLVRAVPLMLTGGAVAIAFRAGVFNIGAEGQLLLGATGAMGATLALPSGGIVTTASALVCGALAGALWGGIAAVLRRYYGVLEVISTIMLNFVALHLVSYLVRGPFQEPTHAYPQTSSIPEAIRLPHVPGAGRLHIGIILALATLALAGWTLRHTAAGFRLISVGESPAAAEVAGRVDSRRVTFNVLIVSGALAGLAGAVEVLGVTYALYEDISPGYGYTAIAVALLANLDPWRAAISAFGFAALEAGASAMQRDAGVPSTLSSVIEALLILVIISALGRVRLSAVLKPYSGERSKPA